MNLLTPPFIAAWADDLATSDAYRAAGARWKGSLVFVLHRDDGPDRRAFLDLEGGRCLAARPATDADAATADYVLAADEAAWRRLLDDGLDPIWAIMSGKLRLERGSLARLTPHARAAKELVRAARRVAHGAAPASGDGAASAGPSAVPGGGEPAPRADETRPPDSALPLSAPAHRPAAARAAFRSTAPGGLDRGLLPMRLWERAKRVGIWNPSEVDLSRDRRDWAVLGAGERDVLLRLTALFQAGEEAVTLDLLPLLRVMADEGRLEEEIYLTSFLWEEAKHVDAFRRFLDDVAEEASDLTRYHTASYRRIFYDELPRALKRLETDRSPVAQAEASVTYNMIVEGVLAETGYHAYYAALERNGILPGMMEIVGHLKSDEARHLAYGVYLLSRLVAEHGDPVWNAIESRMGRLLEPALGIIDETFAPYDVMPFGLELDEFTGFARDQFRRRVERIEKARRQGLEEVLRWQG